MASTMVNGSGSAGPSSMLNGHAAAASDQAGPSKQTTPDTFENGVDALQQVQQEHDAGIVSHVYQSGFQQGNYADVQLFVLNRSYRLHRLILSRSPYLEHLIRTPNDGRIFVPLENMPHITDESFAIALGYLYGSASLALVSPANARSVLATGCLLGGMDDLCAHAYELCKSSISVETLDDWLGFIQEFPLPSQLETNGGGGGSSTNGANTPTLASPIAQSPHPLAPSPFGPPTPISAHGLLPPHLQDHRLYMNGGHHSPISSIPGTPITPTSTTASIFGPYGPRLRDDVFTFLTVSLPEQLVASNSSGGPAGVYKALSDVYVRLPFEYFKAAVEAPGFPIANDQERFKFAKSVVAARKRGVGRDVEETVVLAFGGVGDGGSAVHITRKMRGGRRLWKVGGGK